MSNAAISYLYRDGSNNKLSYTAVLAGYLDAEQKRAIEEACDGMPGEVRHFIPGQVGLPDLQDSFVGPSYWDPGSDHPWHELISVTDTEAEVNAPNGSLGSAADFAMAMRSAHWDEGYLPECHNLMAIRYEGHLDHLAGNLHAANPGENTGLYYTLATPPFVANVTQNPDDPDQLIIEHGTLLQSKSEANDLLAQLIQGGIQEGAPTPGLYALKLITEQSYAAHGIQPDDLGVATVSKTDLLREGLRVEDFIRDLCKSGEIDPSDVGPEPWP